MIERIRPSLPSRQHPETEQEDNAEFGTNLPSYDAAAVHESILQALRMQDDVQDEIHNALKLLRRYELHGEYAYTMLMGLVSLAVSYAGERGTDFDV
ncbi:hypothetical protein MAY45_20385, partial [Escherichia coli]